MTLLGKHTHISAPAIAAFGFVIFCIGFAWLFGDVLLPFVLGGVTAYLLNPIVERLDNINRVKRSWAVLMILFVFLAILGLILALSIPVIVRQGAQFMEDAPALIQQLVNYVLPWLESFRQRLDVAGDFEIREVISNHWKSALSASGAVTQTLTALGTGVTSFITVTIFTVIIAYFMLNEWPYIARWVRDMVPRPYLGTSRYLWARIDRKLSGFVRGQLTVAIILGAAYAIALSIAGLKYGILIGLVSGVLAIIPMVGSTVGLIVSVLVAIVQSGSIVFPAIIAAIYLAGQLIEGNLLTPMIVGDRVGLHPLWVFFALLAGASLMGITGMLIAVPVAAIVSVLLGFAIEQYKNSEFYQGETEEEV